MSASVILNADMATVARTVRAGLRWWLDELAALLPERLRRSRRSHRQVAYYTGAAALMMLGEAGPIAWRRVRRGGPVDLAIDGSLALIRELEMAPIGRADMKRMAMLEADRLLPLPPDQLHVDAAIATADAGDRTIVHIAGLRRTIAEEALAAAEAAAVIPVRVGIAVAPSRHSVAFDFAPELRLAGRLPWRSRAPIVWWSLVAALFLLNIGLLVSRDRQRIDRLDALVTAQAPGLARARTMLHRSAAVMALSQATLTRRRRQEPLADIAVATRVLTDEAWVERLTWDGASMELAGYQQPGVDVLAELRGARRFADARFTTSDVAATALAGQPFDVTVDLNGGLP